MAYPPLVVDAPPITALTGTRFFDVASPLPEGGADRWVLAGITWSPRPSRAMSAGALDACSPADFTHPGYECVAAITQKPFSIWDAFNAQRTEWELSEVDALLNERWGVQLSSVFAGELMSGTASTGQSFKASAHAPAQAAFGSAAVSVQQGVAMLEEDLARTLFGAQGTIWMSPGLLDLYVQHSDLSPAGGKYYTAVGHEICADAGLVDVPAPTGQAVSVAGKEWMYASGPVRYAQAPGKLIGNADNEAMDMTKNKIIRWQIGAGIIQFDPAPVTAILVNY